MTTKQGAWICLVLALCTTIYMVQFHWQQAVAAAQWRSPLDTQPATALSMLLQESGLYIWQLAPFIAALALASWQCSKQSKLWLAPYVLTIVNVMAVCVYWQLGARPSDINGVLMQGILPAYQWLLAAGIWGVLQVARRWLAPN